MEYKAPLVYIYPWFDDTHTHMSISQKIGHKLKDDMICSGMIQYMIWYDMIYYHMKIYDLIVIMIIIMIWYDMM